MSDRWEQIDRVFHEALEVPPPERASFVARECGGDAELLGEVEAMLAAHDDDTPLRIEGRLLADGKEPGADPMLGKRVGPYRLTRLIGRGGMGEVYLAERTDDQFQQRVALKLLRAGHHDPDTAARFRRERQILAQLEHPNIATLLDGGVHDDGRPYLVMQYVDGVHITDFCEHNGLGLRQRLELFCTVCDAVHAAHTNLVVHRDLKPANILVTAGGQVTLLDFGIAKLLDAGDAARTRSMNLVLTPAHAAPEQVSGGAITTATDVYALGVLLYQLLTGHRPINVPTDSPREIERAVREVEPAPPSTRTPRLARILRGELDNITLMALRKEPDRRYPSALQLGEDIRRYLAGLPVRAERDTLWYRSRKFLARNRPAVAVGTLIAGLAIAFAVTSAKQARRVAEERDRARVEQAKSEQIVGIMADLLSTANPRVQPLADTLRVADFIDQIEDAVARIDDQPAVQARMWELLGNVHRARSEFVRAKACFEKALAGYRRQPGRDAEIARVLHDTGMLAMDLEGSRKAEPLLLESLERHVALFGEFHRDAGIAMQDYASSIMSRDPEEAMKWLEKARAVSQTDSLPGSNSDAAVYNGLGIYYLNQSDHDRAWKNFMAALVELRKTLPPTHPYILTVTSNLATTRISMGEYEAAVATHRELLAMKEQVLGPRSREVAGSWEALGTALTYLGRYEESAQAFRNSLGIFRERIGPETWQVSNAMRNIGASLSLNGQHEEGLAYYDSSVALDRRLGNENTSGHAGKRGSRASIAYAAGYHEEAIAEAREALAQVEKWKTNEEDSYPAGVRQALAVMLLDQGQPDEAAELLQDTIAYRERVLDDGHPSLAWARCLLGVAMSQLQQLEVARALLSENYHAIVGWGMASDPGLRLIRDAMASVGLSTN